MAKETDDLLKHARETYESCKGAEQHNRKTALDDILFARKGEQWPQDIQSQRLREGRPCLTINKLPAFIRQVVNDSRQNKPAIKVHPADSKADPQTADVINGLIRNIEYTSNADVAYDTAIESAVTGGFGYWRIVTQYAFDDAFDMDLAIKRVANPFSVYGDPNSSEADSSDWNVAFVVDRLSETQFKRQYGDKARVDWDDDAWNQDGLRGSDWRSDSKILIAEYWTREEVERAIVQLQDGTVLSKEALETDPDLQALAATGALQIHGERMAKSHKVRQRIMSGLEVLEDNDWQGRYIPIVPVYGDEFDIEGRRYFRSLIHNAIDAQRMFNYWRTNATELVALAPKVPFIGRKNAFDSDQERWQTVNTRSHAYLEYDGPEMPMRQQLDMGVAAGSLQEALNASDDIKAIIGVYDASLGAKSNETSGRAILARQREGDVSTFHFIDNLARAIRHTGRILIDLIPHVYTGPRIVRTLGEDGRKVENTPVNQQYPKVDPKTGQPMQEPVIGPDGQPQTGPDGNPLMKPILAIHDLNAGKYDLTVTTGPSFTTRREEAAASMTELIRAFPPAAPIIGPELAKNLDWPGADEIAEKMEAQQAGQVPPQVQQQIQEGQKRLQQLEQENMQLKMDQATDQAKIQSQERMKMLEIQSDEKIAMFKAQSDMKVAAYKAELTAQVQAARPPSNGAQNGQSN